jgi:hypothetical protein
MPRTSFRRKALNGLLSAYNNSCRLFFLYHLHQIIESDIDDDIFDDNDDLFVLLAGWHNRITHIRDSRYLRNRTCRKQGLNVFLQDLSVAGETFWMSEDEFLCKYRVTRDQLDRITGIIAEDPIFKKPLRGFTQMPVKYQLMIWLHFIGHEGQTDSTQRDTFFVSRGMCNNARKRVVKAMNNIRNEYIHWPDADERKEISKRVEKEFHIPNCPLMMDGTLLRLGTEPQCDDAADYHGRKFTYSITVNVINDDEKRIRGYSAGYPGSAHDNRVWKNMKQHRDPEEYFSANEFIMCDTAYEPSWFCVPAFKCASGDGLVLDPNKALFNTVLAKPRVGCEHTMGLWKGRCPWLRNIRMKITNDKASLKEILRYIDATIVLHNMLIDWNQAENKNAAWDESVVTDLTSIDDASRGPLLTERLELDQAIAAGGASDLRRQQLLRYICETYVTHFNYSPLQEFTFFGDSDWSPMQGLEIDTEDDSNSTISDF